MTGVSGRAGVVLRALAAQARTPPPPRPERLDLRPCAAALEAAGARAAVVRVGARAKPWTAAGLEIEDGAAVTWLAHGDSWLLSRRGPHLEAALQLRVRTGGAPPSLQGTGPTHTEAAPRGGPVELCCLFPAEFDGPEERLVHDRQMPRWAAGGGFDVVVAAWPREAEVAAGIARAAESDPTGLCRREADRLADPVVAPPGWEAHENLALLGLHARRDEEIAVRSEGRVEIVCHDARMPLTDDLVLRWRWRVGELPSRDAEHTLLTHDYTSIAVEFDDGQDLTYYWSAALPPETSYRCPLPHWRRRETHLVVRSGPDGLGEWRSEERRIAPDHAKAIGGARPREVVRVWLIATTIVQRREARSAYADIEFAGGGTTLRVL
ncbi:MAG TPA: DUF3047 domain-containing protein [Solirubrobacteraceae bacterium]|jgi:hypothetical protein